MKLSYFVVLFSSFLSGCTHLFPPSSSQALQGYQGALPAHGTYFVEDHEIHYVDTGESDLPTVIFIHGTPGSWDSFEGFFVDPRLRGKARLISVDRPGFGSSSSDLVLSLEGQAKTIEPLLRGDSSDQKTILVGHSLGGPIASRVSMDYADSVDGLVLVAPTVDPELERTKWYQALGRVFFVRWAVPQGLDKANRELKDLKVDLQAMLPLWKEVQADVIVIQGGKDPLVDPRNADFLERVLPSEQADIRSYAELNHFIPWTAPELMVDAILELIEE